MSEKFLTPKQVAELLQVTEKTLRTWNKNKIFTCYKLGRAVRYKESDIIEKFGKK